jgi:copper(I)-binding protein
MEGKVHMMFLEDDEELSESERVEETMELEDSEVFASAGWGTDEDYGSPEDIL